MSGVCIMAHVIEQHLTHITPSTVDYAGCSAVLSVSAAAARLNPDDKQNILLAFCLLAAVAGLRRPLPCDSPGFALKRHLLNLLGQLYCYLLDPITDVTMSLGQQLVQLSAAVHILLTLYAANRGAFMPSQLYYDTQTYIKCAYFCVAKAKLDDPQGRLYIIQLGTNRLEAGFGHVRTMVGGDSNADQLQLASRLSASAECAALFESHKDWNKLCFVCEQDDGERIISSDEHCNRSPGLTIRTAPKLLLHNAAHILAENELTMRNPCGFCLQTNSECRIFLHSKPPEGIDLSKSLCRNLMKVQLASARK